MKAQHLFHSENRIPRDSLSSRFAPGSGKRGSVLIGALLVVLVVTALVGVAFLATNGAARMGGRAKDYVGVQRAAEATVEYGYGVWKQRIFAAGRPITTAEAN